MHYTQSYKMGYESWACELMHECINAQVLEMPKHVSIEQALFNLTLHLGLHCCLKRSKRLFVELR